MSMTLTYESDEDPPSEEVTEKYLWRLDRVESHSDYRIEIEVASSTKHLTDHDDKPRIHVYHVHKSMLALGPRKSEYFARLLQGAFSETLSGVSRIPLNKLAANAFPAVLDFIYGAPKLDCTKNTATALHYLGQYFGIRRLRFQARKFWEKDLNLENCATYYQQASDFHDNRILRRVQVILGSLNLLKLSPESEIMNVIDPPFMLVILQTADLVLNDETKANSSSHVSRLVAHVLESFYVKKLVDAEQNVDQQCVDDSKIFLQLTESFYLPEIDWNAAMTLLRLERTIVNPLADIITDLQQRCIQSLSQNWELMKINDPSTLVALQQIGSAKFLTELFAQALTYAKETVLIQKAENISARTRYDNVQYDFNRLEESMNNLSVTSRRTANYIGRLESEIIQRDTLIRDLRNSENRSQLRIQELEAEVLRFRRLPSEVHVWDAEAEYANIRQPVLKVDMASRCFS
ncbi:hypothetical protein MPSEU_000098700 [Mayamaea pseudoterrestris]|nr:hypothetical protein MPSEU_000098700 [Mayamaea pseudoterrestris]